MSAAQQVESAVWGLGAHHFGLLQNAAQNEVHGVIAHHRDANPGPVCVRDAAD
jgi:hypothetical protein